MLDQHLDELDADDKVQGIFQKVPVFLRAGLQRCQKGQFPDQRIDTDNESQRYDDRYADLEDIHQVFQMRGNGMDQVSAFMVLAVFVVFCLFCSLFFL